MLTYTDFSSPCPTLPVHHISVQITFLTRPHTVLSHCQELHSEYSSPKYSSHLQTVSHASSGHSRVIQISNYASRSSKHIVSIQTSPNIHNTIIANTACLTPIALPFLPPLALSTLCLASQAPGAQPLPSFPSPPHHTTSANAKWQHEPACACTPGAPCIAQTPTTVLKTAATLHIGPHVKIRLRKLSSNKIFEHWIESRDGWMPEIWIWVTYPSLVYS
jgi:hypothetical protein